MNIITVNNIIQLMSKNDMQYACNGIKIGEEIYAFDMEKSDSIPFIYHLESIPSDIKVDGIWSYTPNKGFYKYTNPEVKSNSINELVIATAKALII